MRPRSSARWLLIICIPLLLLTACDQFSRLSQGPPSARVLFIGNSFTAYNGGLDKQLQGFNPSIETGIFGEGGFTLEDHWNDGKAVREIQKGGWNYVVLQEQSQTPIFGAKKFQDYAGYFDSKISASGAQTILLMTWERPDSARAGVTTTNLATVYSNLGKSLNARVAPAGIAFARSLSTRPSLTLYQQDGHPSVAGTYLAACVLYATIFGASPVGNAFADSSISSQDKTFLQKIAAETTGY